MSEPVTPPAIPAALPPDDGWRQDAHGNCFCGRCVAGMDAAALKPLEPGARRHCSGCMGGEPVDAPTAPLKHPCGCDVGDTLCTHGNSPMA